jgi:hypothetical protein
MKPKIETKTTININWDDKWALILLVFIQVIFCYYGLWTNRSILVEMFPAKLDTHPCHYHTM